MRDVMKDKIENRIAELKKARDEFITNANTEVAALNTAIAELKKLLEPEAAEEPATEG